MGKKRGPKPGGKKGGRKKGTPNKITLDLIAALESNNLAPIPELKKVYYKLFPSDRAKVCLQLMDYIYPRRKAVDAGGNSDDSGDYVIKVNWADAESTDSQHAPSDATTKKNQ